MYVRLPACASETNTRRELAGGDGSALLGLVELEESRQTTTKPHEIFDLVEVQGEEVKNVAVQVGVMLGDETYPRACSPSVQASR